MTPTTDRTTTFRRRFGAVSIAAAPVFFAAAEVLYPTDGADPAHEIATNAAHHGRLLLAITCTLISSVLFVPAFFALMNPVRGRGTALTHLGGALALLGNAISGLALVGLQFIVYEASAPGVDHASLVPFIEHATHDPVGAPLVVGHWFFVLGIVLLAIGLYRGRAGYRWASACLGLGPLLDAVLGSAGLEASPAGELFVSVLTDVLFVAGALGLAWWQLTTTNAAWDGRQDVAVPPQAAPAVA
jgi:hypothetical protein